MLTDAALKRLKPREKTFRAADGGGLYIEVKPSGARHWYLKYRWAVKEKRLAFGAYPDVSIAAARDAMRDAKSEMREGRDPSLTRMQRRADASSQNRSLEFIANAWLDLNRPRWTEKHVASSR